MDHLYHGFRDGVSLNLQDGARVVMFNEFLNSEEANSGTMHIGNYSGEYNFNAKRVLLTARINADNSEHNIRVVPYIDDDNTTLYQLREVYAPEINYDLSRNLLTIGFWTNFIEDVIEYDETKIFDLANKEEGENSDGFLWKTEIPQGLTRAYCTASGMFLHGDVGGGIVVGTDSDNDYVPVFYKPRVMLTLPYYGSGNSYLPSTYDDVYYHVKNIGEEDIPPYSCVESVGIIKEYNVYEVQKPSDDSLNQVFITGNYTILAGTVGVASVKWPLRVKYVGTAPTIGEKCGTTSGSYEVTAGNKGLICYSVDETEGLCWVRPFRTSGWYRFNTSEENILTLRRNFIELSSDPYSIWGYTGGSNGPFYGEIFSKYSFYGNGGIEPSYDLIPQNGFSPEEHWQDNTLTGKKDLIRNYFSCLNPAILARIFQYNSDEQDSDIFKFLDLETDYYDLSYITRPSDNTIYIDAREYGNVILEAYKDQGTALANETFEWYESLNYGKDDYSIIVSNNYHDSFDMSGEPNPYLYLDPSIYLYYINGYSYYISLLARPNLNNPMPSHQRDYETVNYTRCDNISGSNVGIGRSSYDSISNGTGRLYESCNSFTFRGGYYWEAIEYLSGYSTRSAYYTYAISGSGSFYTVSSYFNYDYVFGPLQFVKTNIGWNEEEALIITPPTFGTINSTIQTTYDDQKIVNAWYLPQNTLNDFFIAEHPTWATDSIPYQLYYTTYAAADADASYNQQLWENVDNWVFYNLTHPFWVAVSVEKYLNTLGDIYKNLYKTNLVYRSVLAYFFYCGYVYEDSVYNYEKYHLCIVTIENRKGNNTPEITYSASYDIASYIRNESFLYPGSTTRQKIENWATATGGISEAQFFTVIDELMDSKSTDPLTTYYRLNGPFDMPHKIWIDLFDVTISAEYNSANVQIENEGYTKNNEPFIICRTYTPNPTTIEEYETTGQSQNLSNFRSFFKSNNYDIEFDAPLESSSNTQYDNYIYNHMPVKADIDGDRILMCMPAILAVKNKDVYWPENSSSVTYIKNRNLFLFDPLTDTWEFIFDRMSPEIKSYIRYYDDFFHEVDDPINELTYPTFYTTPNTIVLSLRVGPLHLNIGGERNGKKVWIDRTPLNWNGNDILYDAWTKGDWDMNLSQGYKDLGFEGRKIKDIGFGFKQGIGGVFNYFKPTQEELDKQLFKGKSFDWNKNLLEWDFDETRNEDI